MFLTRQTSSCIIPLSNSLHVRQAVYELGIGWARYSSVQGKVTRRLLCSEQQRQEQGVPLSMVTFEGGQSERESGSVRDMGSLSASGMAEAMSISWST